MKGKGKMANGKLRATRHNGRSNKNGIYRAGHNDRTFNVDNADHIDNERGIYNVYWDCYQGLNMAEKDGTRPAFKYNFEQIETLFYTEKFWDSIDAQNERHIKSRHTERIRTVKDILENEKTCPEETVYQLGTKDGSADPALFVQVVTELFEELQKRFGSNMQILDWSLHMDEETPHIHERHVFFADDGYGMDFPKQDKAMESLGFERPKPDKKQGRNNNRKMSFDEEVRRLYIDIAEKNGITIEKVPIDGKKHMEKNDFIIAKQKEEIADRQAKLDEITMKIEDVEGMIDDVSKTAYDKACEVVAKSMHSQTMKQDMAIIGEFRDRMLETSGNGEKKKYTKLLLDTLINVIGDRGRNVAEMIKDSLMKPEVKKLGEEEIAKVARVSMKDRLNRAKQQARENEEKRHSTPNRGRGYSL
jgi:hypothetical protein